MELKTTEEFVREAHSAACSTWKTKIEKEFPELFKTELEVGKWYKGSVDFESLIFITEIENASHYNRVYYYGFINNTYRKGDYIANKEHEASLIPASPEEIEALLISEAKKRGYKKGVIIIPVNAYNTKLTISSDIFKITECGGLNVFNNDGSIQFEQNTYACLFASGKWATILPEQKNTISKEKALKIIAKKLKVSPESIEIK